MKILNPLRHYNKQNELAEFLQPLLVYSNNSNKLDVINYRISIFNRLNKSNFHADIIDNIITIYEGLKPT